VNADGRRRWDIFLLLIIIIIVLLRKRVSSEREGPRRHVQQL